MSIKHIKVIKTKQSKEMAFIDIDDGHTELECTLFDYDKFKAILAKDMFIVKIRKDSYKNKMSYVIASMKPLKEITSL